MKFLIVNAFILATIQIVFSYSSSYGNSRYSSPDSSSRYSAPYSSSRYSSPRYSSPRYSSPRYSSPRYSSPRDSSYYRNPYDSSYDRNPYDSSYQRRSRTPVTSINENEHHNNTHALASSAYNKYGYKSQNAQEETNNRNQISVSKSRFGSHGSYGKTNQVVTNNGKYNTATSAVQTKGYNGQNGQSRIKNVQSNYNQNTNIDSNGGATSTLNDLKNKQLQGAASSNVVTSRYQGANGQSFINNTHNHYFNQKISSPYGTDASVTNAHTKKSSQAASHSVVLTQSDEVSHGESNVGNQNKRFYHVATSNPNGAAASETNVNTNKANQAAAQFKQITSSRAAQNGQSLVTNKNKKYFHVNQVSSGGTAQDTLNVQTRKNTQGAAMSKLIKRGLKRENGQSLTTAKTNDYYSNKFTTPDGGAGETQNVQSRLGTHGVANSKRITRTSAEQNAQSNTMSENAKTYHTLVYG